MTDVTRSDFDDIPLDGFRRDDVPPRKIVKKTDFKKKPGFLPSNTPIPFWLDLVFFMLWCGFVGLSIIMAFFMANLPVGFTVFFGSAAAILMVRTAIKRFLLSKE